MPIAIVSDSHIPSRAREIPEPFRERIRAADLVVHAGDFDSESALADVRDLADDLVAVAGNMDPRVGLPRVSTLEVDGVEFVVTHGSGPKRGYHNRVANTVREESEGEDPVGISGHTHEVLDTVHNGLRLLNPGSVTAASPATRATMMTAEVHDGDVDVTVHEL